MPGRSSAKVRRVLRPSGVRDEETSSRARERRALSPPGGVAPAARVAPGVPPAPAAGSPGQCCLFLESCEAGRAAPVLLWAQIWAPTARLPAGFWNVLQPRHNPATGAGRLRPCSVRGLGVILGWRGAAFALGSVMWEQQ